MIHPRYGGNYFNKYESRNPVARFLTEKFVATLLDLGAKTSASRVHEVGCGEGYISARFAGAGYEVLGTDPSKKTLEVAQKIVVDGKVRFELADIGDLETQEHGAPLVLCCEVLEHLEDPGGALQKLGELAQPFVILSVPSEPLWRMLNFISGRYLFALGNTPGHLQHWSPRGFVGLIEQHFEILEIRTPLPWTVVLARRSA